MYLNMIFICLINFTMLKCLLVCCFFIILDCLILMTRKFIWDYFMLRLIELLIDFNDMSIHLGLFYAERLENNINCTFLFTFFV